MRVQFIRDVQYENEGPKKGPKFAKGERYDFTEDFANRWKRRGAAEEVEGGEDADMVGPDGPFVAVDDAAPSSPKTPRKSKGKGAGAPEDDEKSSVAFNVGDKVVLQTGGPEMAVVELTADGQVKTAWTNTDGTAGEGIYAPEALAPAPTA